MKRSYEKNGILIFIFTILSSGLNYLFQILAGRFLCPSDFGELNSLFSILNIVTVLGSSLSISMVTVLSADIFSLNTTFISMMKKVCIACPFLILVVTLVLKMLGYSFLISVLVALTACFICVASLYCGKLQTLQLFVFIGIFNLIQPLIKILAGNLILYAGLGYYFVFPIMIFGAILSIIFAHIIIKKYHINDAKNIDYSKDIFSLFKFCLISSVGIVIFSNIDILAIKFLFNSETAGLYSSAALFGKIILYIPTALITVMIPTVASNTLNGLSVLKKTLLYSFGLSGAAAVVLYIMRKFIITLLMGEQYLASELYIFFICLMILPVVGITVLINYLIAQKDKLFITLMTTLSIIAATVISLCFHNSVELVLIQFAAVYTIFFIILLIRSFVFKNDEE